MDSCVYIMSKVFTKGGDRRIENMSAYNFEKIKYVCIKTVRTHAHAYNTYTAPRRRGFALVQFFPTYTLPRQSREPGIYGRPDKNRAVNHRGYTKGAFTLYFFFLNDLIFSPPLLLILFRVFFSRSHDKKTFFSKRAL